MKSEPVEFGIALTQPVQLVGVLVPQVLGVGHHPGGDLADRWRLRSRVGCVSAPGPVAPQMPLNSQLAAWIAELLDLAVELGGVPDALVPAPAQVADVRVDDMRSLEALGHDIICGTGVDQFTDGGLVQPELPADRRLRHPLLPQLMGRSVLLTQPDHDHRW
ncbi:hypothetical protein [Streptomyces sp. ATMOS53]